MTAERRLMPAIRARVLFKLGRVYKHGTRGHSIFTKLKKVSTLSKYLLLFSRRSRILWADREKFIYEI